MPPKKKAPAKKAAKKVATKKAKVAPAKKSIYQILQEVMLAEKKFKVGDNVIIHGEDDAEHLGFKGLREGNSHGDGDEATIKKIEDDGIVVFTKRHGTDRLSKIPIFNLEKMGPRIKLGASGYEASIQADGSVRVGCTHVDTKTLDAIVAASMKARSEGI